jgi:ankyrin repeat protein
MVDLESVTKLYQAVEFGNSRQVTEVLKALPVRGRLEVLSEKDREGDTVLHYVARYGDGETAQAILALYPKDKVKAAVNKKNNTGNTPFHYAAARGFDDLVELFLAQGADSRIDNNQKKTPLDLAAELMLEQLLIAKARLQTIL